MRDGNEVRPCMPTSHEQNMGELNQRSRQEDKKKKTFCFRVRRRGLGLINRSACTAKVPPRFAAVRTARYVRALVPDAAPVPATPRDVTGHRPPRPGRPFPEALGSRRHRPDADGAG